MQVHIYGCMLVERNGVIVSVMQFALSFIGTVPTVRASCRISGGLYEAKQQEQDSTDENKGEKTCFVRTKENKSERDYVAEERKVMVIFFV